MQIDLQLLQVIKFQSIQIMMMAGILRETWF